jgi:hypothetical protein
MASVKILKASSKLPSDWVACRAARAVSEETAPAQARLHYLMRGGDVVQLTGQKAVARLASERSTLNSQRLFKVHQRLAVLLL